MFAVNESSFNQVSYPPTYSSQSQRRDVNHLAGPWSKITGNPRKERESTTIGFGLTPDWLEKSGARFFSQSRQPTARFSLIISPADPPSKEHSLVLLAFYFWLEPGSWPQRNQLDWGRYFWPRNKTELTQQVSCLESDTPCNADARIWDKHKCWTLILRMELTT